MIYESIRVFRLYCGFTCENIALATGIPLYRYKNIETGKVEPTDEEIEKLAKLYNISGNELKCGIVDDNKFQLRQSIDDNIFENKEMRQIAKMTVTGLSDAEKKLIMLIRSKEMPKLLIEKLIDCIVSEE